jgi:hypothetical protein
MPSLRLLTLLCGFVAASSSAFGQTEDRRAIDAIDGIFQLVFQIKTAVGPDAPKASYGSGFVVAEDGLLATNFHVVAHALHEPEKYKIYLVDGDDVLEARVVNTNVVNDLALVRVDRRFPRALRFALEAPRVGEKMYSLGLPEDLNKAVIEGNYNGVVYEGPYRKIQMSLPLNSGMSGGPTVNVRGELVGVNVSVLLFAQNLAFAVPADLVQNLMKAGEQPYTKKDGVNTLDVDIERQLTKVQDELMELIKGSPGAKLTLPGFTMRKPPAILKCWRTNEDGRKQRWSRVSEQCYLGNAAMISEQKYGGTFRVTHQVLETKRLNALQFWGFVADTAFGDNDDFANWMPDFSTRFDCKVQDLVNAHGLPLRLSYCLNTYVRMRGLYDVDFRIVTMSPGRRALVIFGLYSAFSEANVQELLRLTVDGIEAT